MYKIPEKTITSIDLNTSVEGDTIEETIIKLLNNGAPIDSEKMPMYTKPSDGVVYGSNIRDDKWERGIEINEKINKDIDRIRNLKVVKVEDKEEESKKTENNENSEQTGEK